MTKSAPFTRFRLLLAGLKHYWRSQLAVALGTAIAAAVLAGALVVGDSVKASLRAMTFERLGAVDFAVTGPRFFREQLADDVVAAAQQEGQTVRVAPALMATAAVEFQQDETLRRAAGVQVIGCDERLWGFLHDGNLKAPAADEIVLSPRLAEQLQVQPGSQLSVLVEIPQAIPRDSLLGDREQTVAELLLTVSVIADETTSIARFGLNPSQQLPRNAFVNLRQLQDQLNVAETAASRRNPVAKPARVNSLFFSRAAAQSTAEGDTQAAQALTTALHKTIQLSDLHLRLIDHPDRGYISLESEQMLLDRGISDYALKTARQMNCEATPILVYLLNEVRNASEPERHSMYAIAAGIDPDAFEKGPAAPPASQEALQLLAAAAGPHPAPPEFPEVAINAWLAEDLGVDIGDRLLVKYHQVGDRGELPEIEQTFQVAAVAPLEVPWDDRGLTPYVPGITDAETFREWRQPFPMKMEEITPRDEEYWKLHRATPKVFLPLAAAEDLWRSRYGDMTSLRTRGTTVEAFEKSFLSNLPPTTSGLTVQPVKQQGLAAAEGTTDFAGLFLGFSFFLIGAATILIAILFRLMVERRIRELGLLTAVGWTPRSVFRHALWEAMVVVAVGALLGLPLAVAYAGLMIHGLKTWWNAAVGTQFLFLSVNPVRLLIGGFSTVLIAAAAVWFALRSARRVSTRAMLSGVVDQETGRRATNSARWRTPIVCAIAAALLVTCSLAGLIPSQEAFAGISWVAVSFFVSGGLALTAGMTLFGALLRQPPAAIRPTGITWPRLCFRNTARNPRRSTLTAGLVAAAAFLVAAVASGKRDPAAELPRRDSGDGGFLLVAESSTPVLYDLNTEYGRSQLGITDDPSRPWPAKQVVPFRVQPGENASCLNLYQTQLPTILALPDPLIEQFARESRFKFIGMPAAEGWRKLLQPVGDNLTPVLGDMNTLQYSLHKGPGDHVPLDAAPTRQGHELQIAGMFDGSVFQGVLVMAESQFLKLYPERAGFQYFLIETTQPASVEEAHRLADAASDALESQLRDYGLDAERVANRLADFLAVQNTYLSTFQTLGGLGLLLGVFGLFAVMLRNVLERRGELALMRAVGLPNSKTALMVVGENLLLVTWGLVTGVGAALLAMAPQLITTGSMPPWRGLAMMAAGLLVAGGIAALIALRDAFSAPIIAALRDE